MTIPRLAELGVARVSTGSLLYRVALGAALDAAANLKGQSLYVPEAPSYAEINDLAR